MKKLKILFFGFIVFIFTFGLIQLAPINLPSYKTSSDIINKPDYNPLGYVSLVSEGQPLTYNNLTRIEPSYYSVMINGATTINLNPFNTKYRNLSNFDETYFTKNIIEVEITYSLVNPMEFTYKGREMVCHIGNDEYSRKYYSFSYKTGERLPVTTQDNIAITYVENTIVDNGVTKIESIKFTFIDSVTVNVNKIDDFAEFRFSPIIDLGAKNPQAYEITLKFFKPVVRFSNAQNPILTFEAFKDYNTEKNKYDFIETDSLLQSEQTFNKLRLTFLNDQYEYSKDNPLYFRINFNGFSYNFTFYSEVIEGKELKPNKKDTDEGESFTRNCLFVKYYDEVSNTTKHLASNIEEFYNDYDGTPYNVFIESVSSNNQFTMNFTYRGRYEIEFYDNTYLQNYKNPNYYKTSFYLENDSNSEKGIESKFDNIYILAQSIDDNNEPLEYIVNTATLNTSVKVMLKNLPENLLVNDVNELASIIDKIDVTITVYGNSAGNHPVRTSYYPTTLENQFDENIKKLNNLFSIDENGDYYLICNEDAHYKIDIQKTFYDQAYDINNQPLYDENNEPKLIARTEHITYIFSVLKNTKASFDPVDDSDFDSSFTATIPYKTIPMEYTNSIKNSDPIRFTLEYKNQTPLTPERVLDITYKNVYTVKYGMQVAEIKAEINGDNDEITFTFWGVGDMIAEINFNGEITQYKFNSENNKNSITFTDYGKYYVTLVDSMNTVAAPESINFSKGLNMSAIILIVLSGIIVAFVTVFIISVRGRVKTR